MDNIDESLKQWPDIKLTELLFLKDKVMDIKQQGAGLKEMVSTSRRDDFVGPILIMRFSDQRPDWSPQQPEYRFAWSPRYDLCTVCILVGKYMNSP